MLKKEIAVKLASALLNTKVDEDNWKVKDLMGRTKADLESHLHLANNILMKNMTVAHMDNTSN